MKKLLAAFIFFTRLPFWRIAKVPAEYYKRVVELWPLTGWLTGGIMALAFWGASHLFPIPCAVIIALVIRLLVTGALHEDGFADFADGFGGGTSRTSVLAIMKDSHIGTYGVLALLLYYALMITLLSSFSVKLLCMAMIGADSWSKACASQIVNLLPYARKENEAKNRTIYSRMSPIAWMINIAAGALPLLLLPDITWAAAIAPVIVSLTLFAFMRHKIQGYTGDCCGATFIFCELSFYLGLRVCLELA